MSDCSDICGAEGSVCSRETIESGKCMLWFDICAGEEIQAEDWVRINNLWGKASDLEGCVGTPRADDALVVRSRVPRGYRALAPGEILQEGDRLYNVREASFSLIYVDPPPSRIGMERRYWVGADNRTYLVLRKENYMSTQESIKHDAELETRDEPRCSYCHEPDPDTILGGAAMHYECLEHVKKHAIAGSQEIVTILTLDAGTLSSAGAAHYECQERAWGTVKAQKCGHCGANSGKHGNPHNICPKCWTSTTRVERVLAGWEKDARRVHTGREPAWLDVSELEWAKGLQKPTIQVGYDCQWGEEFER